MEIITSTSNPKIKFWDKLKSKKGREKEQRFLIEGTKLIAEAIKGNYHIDDIIIEEDSEQLEVVQKLLKDNEFNPPITMVSKQVVNKLTDTETPQGVFAVLKKKEISLNNILRKQFLLLLDGIQDPGNLGTIIRSADASGVEAIILGKGTVDLYNSKVVRSAMGSIFHLTIIEAELDDLIPMLQQQQFRIFGSSPYADDSYFDIDLTGKSAILIGNEAKGLAKARMETVDQMVNIPIKGGAESLNVAVATALLLYERVRQLEKKA